MVKDDAVVERVRAARRQLLAEAGGDAHRLYELTKQFEQRQSRRVITLRELRGRREADGTSAFETT